MVSSATMLRSLLFIFLFNSAVKVVYGKHLIWDDSTSGSFGIIGGHEVDIKQYPHQISLQVHYQGNWLYHCGGSIINENYVVTATRCVYGIDPDALRVRVGSSAPVDGGEVYDVLSVVIHPKFNADNLDYGVALLKTKKIVLNGETTKAAQLPEEGSILKPGEKIVTTGWGYTKDHGNLSNVLRAGSLPAVSLEKCAQIYKDIMPITLTDRMICAGLDESGVSPCDGDIGDPAVTESNSVLYGLLMFGASTTCTTAKVPAIYANVAAVRDWIKETTGV